MSALRRHLASMGLAMALCHIVMQVLVPAALCCETVQKNVQIGQKDCCPAGSHPGQICPMHGKSRASAPDRSECRAESQINLHDLLVVLAIGGIVSTPTELTAPVGSEKAPAVIQPSLEIDLVAPPGPPPRA